MELGYAACSRTQGWTKEVWAEGGVYSVLCCLLNGNDYNSVDNSLLEETDFLNNLKSIL